MTDDSPTTTQLLLAIDDYSLPLKKNLCLYLSKPQMRVQPVLMPSREDRKAPDFIATAFYGTVLCEEGRFRMLYYALGQGEPGAPHIDGPMCYAESRDGIQWTKPTYGAGALQVKPEEQRHRSARDEAAEPTNRNHLADQGGRGLGPGAALQAGVQLSPRGPGLLHSAHCHQRRRFELDSWPRAADRRVRPSFIKATVL